MHNHAGILDSHAHLDTPLHRLPAGLKLAVALAMVIFTVAARPTPIMFCGIGLLLLVIAFATRVPVMFLIKRMIALEPFVLGIAILTLMRPHGLTAFLTIVSRSTLCLLTLVLLSNTTRFSDLLLVSRRVGVPALIVTTLALMYRYLFVLKDESERMRAARASRTFDTRRHHAWKSLATIISQLFVRANTRAERIYGAMCARGWQ